MEESTANIGGQVGKNLRGGAQGTAAVNSTQQQYTASVLPLHAGTTKLRLTGFCVGPGKASGGATATEATNASQVLVWAPCWWLLEAIAHRHVLQHVHHTLWGVTQRESL